MAAMTIPIVGQSKFVTVKDGHFIKDGQPYYYVGTNFWYGAILGSEGQGGDRQRLCRELDLMKQIGIDNLRILVGSDGERGVTTKVEPTLQVAPGVYNDTILAGLDYLMQELGKRQMVAEQLLGVEWGLRLLSAACRCRQGAKTQRGRLSCLYELCGSVCYEPAGSSAVLWLREIYPGPHEPLYGRGL